MDANRQPFWLIRPNASWVGPGLSLEKSRLVLAAERPRPIGAGEVEAAARLAIDRVPEARDRFGTRARVDAAGVVVAEGAGEAPIAIYTPPAGDVVRDLAVDGEVLYVATGAHLVLVSLRALFDPLALTAPFPITRVVAASGRIYALGVGGVDPARVVRVAILDGGPMPRRPYGPYFGTVFRPESENPDPPRLRVLEANVPLAPGEALAGTAGHPEGGLAVATWEGANAYVRRLDQTLFGARRMLRGCTRPYALAFVEDDLVAVATTIVEGNFREAIAYRLIDAPQLEVHGEIFPLRGDDGGPFVRAPEGAWYRTASGEHRPLARLSLSRRAPRAEARLAPIDSGRHGTVWHRLNLEMLLPPGTALEIQLGATEFANAEPEWFPHVAGAIAAEPDVPRAVWVPARSEIPFHRGLLGCDLRPGESGLFTVLIQRAGLRTRRIAGRFLHVRLVLTGNGRASPELAAVRAYGHRFSYAEQYLPRIYRETVFGDLADERAPATGPDFLERFLANAEGVLTPIEDRISAAHALTVPDTVPAESLEWLGSWIGVALDPSLSEGARRRAIREGMRLHAWRGTQRGLELWLDIATEGAVGRGEVLVVEDFRLRRTFATLLGVELGRKDDPLLPGLNVSANSILGDTLFLGEESKREFLALFDDRLITDPVDRQIVAAFFDALAFRVTVLVRHDAAQSFVDRVRAVVAREAPAHLVTRIVHAHVPMIVGIASLIGVDTFLAAKPPQRHVRLGESALGAGDTLFRPAALDPRLEGEST